MTGRPDDHREMVMDEEPRDDNEDGELSHVVVVMFAVFSEVGLAPFSLFLGWLLAHPPLITFQWDPKDTMIGVLAAVPLILLFLVMITWPIGPLVAVKEFCDQEVVGLFHDSSWSELALISLTAGVGEEMLFRGVIQASLADWLGITTGITLTSILFGVLHPISYAYVVITAILGLYLGAIWVYNGNLITVMITHGLYDFAALAYLIKLRN